MAPRSGKTVVFGSLRAPLFILATQRKRRGFYAVLAAMRSLGRQSDHAVESLLTHWETRTPTGPCHYGIGRLFMQVEFPFLRYNLFFYVYVLSFFARARTDRRFLEALGTLGKKLNPAGEVIVERPHRGLKGLTFCAKGRPSKAATKRYLQIARNLAS